MSRGAGAKKSASPRQQSTMDFIKSALGSTEREPGWEYGQVLPVRARKNEEGEMEREWGLGYSNTAKGMLDAVTLPRRALEGEEVSPEQAMEMAMNITAPGVATARYAPGVLNMPIVYHGTPHRFAPTPDNPLGEFDASKIGSGEGAQAYGHGLYLAESPDVASGYKSRLSASTYIKDSVPIKSGMIWQKAADAALEIGKLHPDNAGQISSQIMDWVDSGKKPETFLKFNKVSPQLQSAYEAAVKEYAGAMKNKGSLYTADLPDEMVDKMLDWDKPLSEQSVAVKEMLRKSPLAPDESVWPQWTGQQFYEAEVRAMTEFDKLQKGPSRASVSDAIRQTGILGIKYLDQGSRDKGKGTRNFVLFPGEEKKAKILKRD